MDDGSVLLAALHDRPADELAWLAYADWLEEHDQPGPGELARLLVSIRQQHGGHYLPHHEQRVRDLLAAGVRPAPPMLVNSLGMAFALYEMKVVLSTLFATVHLARPPNSRSTPIRRGLPLAPDDDAQMTVVEPRT